MSLKNMLDYCKVEKVQTNNLLLEIARKVVNSSPEPRYKIKLRDEILAMKEKERLGFNFNRSVTASLKSRWDVVEKATVDYLQEVLDMNEQIEDDDRKYENQLINLIVTRTTNIGLNSRIEQMAALFMHMNFYCTVLKFKIQHLEPSRAFMFTCSDLMGFSRPSQLVDRYAALQHVFTELYADYETRQNLLNHFTETLSEVKSETNHRNMLMHNQMAQMHTRIKQLQTESSHLERLILDQMEVSSGASLEIYKIKNAVHNIYMTMMNYRGLEAVHIDSFEQLDELEVRITHTQCAVKLLLLEEFRRRTRKRSRGKTEAIESAQEDVFSESNSEDESDFNKSAKYSFSAVEQSLNSERKPQIGKRKGPGISIMREPVKVPPKYLKELLTRPQWLRLPAIKNEALIVASLDTAKEEKSNDTKQISALSSYISDRERKDATKKRTKTRNVNNKDRLPMQRSQIIKRSASAANDTVSRHTSEAKPEAGKLPEIVNDLEAGTRNCEGTKVGSARERKAGISPDKTLDEAMKKLRQFKKQVKCNQTEMTESAKKGRQNNMK